MLLVCYCRPAPVHAAPTQNSVAGQEMQVYAREQIKSTTGQDIERQQPQIASHKVEGASHRVEYVEPTTLKPKDPPWTHGVSRVPQCLFRPLNFVFHGGSGSEKHHITTAAATEAV